MKTRTTSLALILTLTATLVCAQPNTADVFEQSKKLGRGVNIIGYDPIWRSKEQARFQEKYFRLLSEAGFNSVRINLHPFRHMEATDGWPLRESWFEVLDWAVKHAQARGLMVILDLHEFNAIGKDPEANKEKLLAFWRQISARYQNAPSSVVFEILNEPSQKLTPEMWNGYLREALAIIRDQNPTRTVIIGPAFWNSVDRLHELELPDTDRNLIVTVHYYKPMEFTHQGASWSNQRDKLGVDWLGTPEQLGAIKRDFDKVSAWAREHNRPIYLGEFGAYDKAPMESRVRYISSVTRAAEERGWSWGYWQFDSDFILYDVKRDAWVEPILRALIPPAAGADNQP
ncbi:MAG: glycoside hydrolase family 5 protein [Verrucomicrobia bacterium]|nr:glycoside hydrolase family 5 protein [Verrucomicrobiota bacterium]